MAVRELVLLKLCDEIAESLALTWEFPYEYGDAATIAHKRSAATLAMLEQRNRLLRELDRHEALSGLRVRLLRVQRHLLRMVLSEQELDCELACRIVEHLYGENSASGWSSVAQQLSADLCFVLTRPPRELSHGLALGDV